MRGAVDSARSPVSSTVVTRKEIESRNLRVLDQALTTVEGVAAYRTRGVQDGDFGVGMRGFSGRGSGQSRVLVLLDGQPINNGYTGSVNWASLPVGEVDRVEVARGPFSSLYGGNAMGGVVNILTRPVERRTVEVTGQFGQQGTAAWSGRYADRFFGRLGVAFGYSHLEADGYRSQYVLRPATDSSPTAGVQVDGPVRWATPTGGITYEVGMRGKTAYDQQAYRARAEYGFDARTFASVQYIRQSSGYQWGQCSSNLRSASGATIDNGAVVFQDAGAWKRLTVTPGNFLGGNGSGESNTYQGQVLRTLSSRGELRLQAGMVDVPSDGYVTPATDATFAGGPGTTTAQHNRSSYVSVQWSLSGAGRHSLTAGADTRVDSADITVSPVANYRATADTIGARDTYSAGRTFNQSAYLQDAIAISDAVRLVAGARYDYWRTDDGETQTAATQPVTQFPRRSTGALSGKVAAVYRVTDATVLRASVGTAFRNPSVYELYRDLRFSSGLLLLGNPNVDPERMASWEAGVRQRVGAGMDVDAAYFENHISDMIYRTSDLVADPTGQTRRLTNAGKGRTRGVELAGTERPFAWLTLRQTYTFNDAVIVENPALPETEGRLVPSVPRHGASMTVTAAAARWAATLTGRVQAAVFATDTNTDVIHDVPTGYDTIREADLTVSYQATRRVGVYLNADNVFGTRFFTYYINPGRVVLAGVRLRY